LRWLLVAIIAYALAVIEPSVFASGGLAVMVDRHASQPDLLLALGLFLAFFFPLREVFVAGWFLGLTSDLVGVAGRLGLKALLFCLVLYLVSHLRGNLPRQRAIVQFAVALATVFAVHVIWHLATALVGGVWPQVPRSAEIAFLDALYTAVLVPYLFWMFLLLRSPLGLSASALGKRD
jgi:rod shape-determining protein MreD